MAPCQQWPYHDHTKSTTLPSTCSTCCKPATVLVRQPSVPLGPFPRCLISSFNLSPIPSSTICCSLQPMPARLALARRALTSGFPLCPVPPLACFFLSRYQSPLQPPSVSNHPSRIPSKAGNHPRALHVSSQVTLVWSKAPHPSAAVFVSSTLLLFTAQSAFQRSPQLVWGIFDIFLLLARLLPRNNSRHISCLAASCASCTTRDHDNIIQNAGP